MERVKSKVAHELLLVVLVVALVVLVVLTIEQGRRVHALTLQMNAAYQKTFYETTELLAGAQINMEKLLVSSTGKRQRSLLISISRQADGAKDNLAMMPLQHEVISGALKFVNQLGDYCRVLAESNTDEGKLSTDELNQISVLHAHLTQLSLKLYDIVDQYERGELVFAATDVIPEEGESQPSEPDVNYPALLYDGPFSDAANTGRLTELGEANVSSAQAREILKNYIGVERVQSIEFLGESELITPCYEFMVTTPEGALDAGVTQRGGKILYILPESGEGTATLSQGECIDNAAKFLDRNSYGEMKVSYFRQLGGILTVNFAAVQDGIILYPDLVKVQVSMRTGEVIGIEAGNYLRNHSRRDLPKVEITFEDALRQISDLLSVSGTRLCLIPVDQKEVLCWEASAYREEAQDQYLIYIDAVTGQEVLILRLTQDEEGYVTAMSEGGAAAVAG